jgi:prepilin peptidase CpaA
MLLQAIVMVGCPVFLALGAMTDILSYRIPNWIPAALIVLFAVAAPLSGMPLATIGWHALVFVGCLLFGMGLFALNTIGGGDAKFLAGAALWMGPAMILKYFVAFAFVGGILAVIILALRRVVLPASAARIPIISQLMLPSAGIPYGVALGIGGLITLPGTELFMKAMTL